MAIPRLKLQARGSSRHSSSRMLIQKSNTSKWYTDSSKCIPSQIPCHQWPRGMRSPPRVKKEPREWSYMCSGHPCWHFFDPWSKCSSRSFRSLMESNYAYRDIWWENIICRVEDESKEFFIDWEDAAMPPTFAQPSFCGGDPLTGYVLSWSRVWYLGYQASDSNVLGYMALGFSGNAKAWRAYLQEANWVRKMF